MLPVVQFSFAIFYPATFRMLRLFWPYHTFIFQQSIVTLYDAFSYIHRHPVFPPLLHGLIHCNISFTFVFRKLFRSYV